MWQQFVDTLSSDFNSWYNPATSQAFLWTGGVTLDFASWKTRTRQDAHSVFASVRLPRAPANVRLLK